MAQSKFIKEIKKEIQVRLDGYNRELKELENASKRIEELKGMVKEAEAELKEYHDPDDDNQAEKASPSEE